MRYKLKFFNLIKLTLASSIANPFLTFSNAVTFLFCLVLFELSPGFIFLFFFSLYAYLFLTINKSLLKTEQDK
jgi:uncharacterized membrane protein YesL